jgi:hypothetical protein
MPVYQTGDLVRYRTPIDWDDAVAIGIILEMRAVPLRQPDTWVLWNDMPEPQWFPISDLVPVQPDGEPGITGS